jgi:hypothetical protein
VALALAAALVFGLGTRFAAAGETARPLGIVDLERRYCSSGLVAVLLDVDLAMLGPVLGLLMRASLAANGWFSRSGSTARCYLIPWMGIRTIQLCRDRAESVYAIQGA